VKKFKGWLRSEAQRQFALKECKGASSAPKPKRRPKKMQKAPRANFAQKLKGETMWFPIMIFKIKGK